MERHGPLVQHRAPLPRAGRRPRPPDPGRRGAAQQPRHDDLRRAGRPGQPDRLAADRAPGRRRDDRRCADVPGPGDGRRRPRHPQGGRRLPARRAEPSGGPYRPDAGADRRLDRSHHGPHPRHRAARSGHRTGAGGPSPGGVDAPAAPALHGGLPRLRDLHLGQHRYAQGRRRHPPAGAQPHRLVPPDLRLRRARPRPVRDLAGLRPVGVRHLRRARLRRRPLPRRRGAAARPGPAAGRAARRAHHLLELRADDARPGRPAAADGPSGRSGRAAAGLPER